MAAIDPYAPCPCGSDQKYKWCCQGVEPIVERAERLFEGNQVEAAFQAIDEGLRKSPDNPWLLTRKAVYEIRRGKIEAAKPLLEKLLVKQPAHLGALGLLIRVTLELEGSVGGVSALQRALGAVEREKHGKLAPLAQIVGMMLDESGYVPAAIEHLTLALELVEGDDSVVESSLRRVLANPSTSAWLRNIYELSSPPEGLAGPVRERFEAAIEWALQGLWSSSAAAFETLSADRVPLADRNLGLCRLWLADHSAAAEALRRHLSTAGATEEAVDLEALCQIVAPPREEDLVEQVGQRWTIRNRDALLKALRGDASIDDEGEFPTDPEDENSPTGLSFALLDRPKFVGSTLPEKLDQIPRILGRVLIDEEFVILETFDDGRLDRLMKRFVELAGTAIPHAHPKTNVLGNVSRPALLMQTEFWAPKDVNGVALSKLYASERVRLVRDVWVETPMSFLKGKTPRQAARAGNAEVPLRAAVCQFEVTHEFQRIGFDFPALRADLKLADEPTIDPETVNILDVHLARLHRIPVDRLDDDRLIQLFDRAHNAVLPLALERSATALATRPSALSDQRPGAFIIYADLANLAMSRGDDAEAFELCRRGRSSDPHAARDAVRWDLMEVRLQARSQKPEIWVPQLAVVLERYREDRQAGSTILSNLVDMGLVQIAPNPDRPEEMLLDTRGLQAVLTRYGPKITTSTGRLGVSATQGGIWTPGSQAGNSSGGLWTPGSNPPPATGSDKPKLIIPGR